MRREDFCDALGDINETYVKEARTPRRTKKAVWLKWGAMAACLALVLTVAVPQFRQRFSGQGEGPRPGGVAGSSETQAGTDEETTVPAIQLIVNEIDYMAGIDMDVQITSYEELPPNAWEAVLDDFYGFAGISYDGFTSKLPDTWEVSDFYSLSVPGDQDDTYRIHDYVFDCLTDSGGNAAIALCSFEEPLRDHFIECDDFERSVIYDTSLVIYGYGECYMVQFSHENVNYDIETSNVALDELQDLLLGILDESATD